jgi:beta-N-acetylglucosaminidase
MIKVVSAVSLLICMAIIADPQIQASKEAKLAAEREASTRAYDEWNHTLHERIKYVEDKDYLLANKKAYICYLSLDKAQRLKEDCLDKEKKSKIEQQKEDPNYYRVFCSDKDQPFKEVMA